MKSFVKMIAKLILLSLALSALAFSVYSLYLNLPFSINQEERFIHLNYSSSLQESYAEKMQFYPNMRFRTLPISFGFDPECSQRRHENVKNAFTLLEEKTILKFEPRENKPEVFIECSEKYKDEEGLFIAGHGGPKVIINSTQYSVILKGTIKLFSESCDYNVELHEILHVLGFDHSTNSNSIMYNVSSCDQQLTEDIINELNRLYRIESLPDLYFQNIDSFKKGRYLNINFAVINQGLVDASNFKVVLFADESRIDEFVIEGIEIGAGKVISAQNLRLPSHRIQSLSLVIDENNSIKELNEDNNKIELVPG